MTLEVVLQSLVSGLLMGGVYALIAAGLSLIFGLMELVNFAHGEFLMLAMFATFWAWSLGHVDPLLSLPLTAGGLFALGVLVYRGIVRHILGGPMLTQIFATFGLAVFLRSGGPRTSASSRTPGWPGGCPSSACSSASPSSWPRWPRSAPSPSCTGS